MNLAKFCCPGAAIALIAACSEAPEAGSEEPAASMADAGAATGPVVDLADYGFLDGGEVSPIAMPDWIPEDLPLPDDFVPVEERKIGTSTFLLRGVTQQPGDGLFDSLSADLREAGYEVREGAGYRSDNLVYFSGNGYEDSTIRIRPGETGSLLEVSLGKVN